METAVVAETAEAMETVEIAEAMEATETDGNAAVVTGDSANIAGYLMALVAAGGIAVVTFFRRKRVK